MTQVSQADSHKVDIEDYVSDSPQIPKEKEAPKDRTHWLYIGVIVAVVGGIALGLIAPDIATGFKPLGTLFIKLITMIIPPIIFCTIVLGIGSVRAAASVGKAGGLALIYFITMSTFCLLYTSDAADE